MSQIPSAASIRARRAEARYPRCPVCTSSDVDGNHVDRCQAEKRYLDIALEAGRAAAIPDVTTVDLWAHAKSRVLNPIYATEVVRLVVDLGWRPVVGSDPARLWTREENPDA